MKKGLILFLAVILCLSSISSVKATDFEGKENEYTEKCKQTESLSKSDLNVCQEFSSYLKDKNKAIENEINQTESQLSQTLENIETTETQLAQTEALIDSVLKEIAVLEAQIVKTTEEINKKEQQLANRMYFLQSYVNGNEYLYLLLSSDSVNQLITRVQNIDELTSYDKDLITSLAIAKAELEVSQEDANVRYNDLFALQTQQMTLLTALGDKAAEYTDSLAQIKDTLAGTRVDIGFIDDSLSEAERRIQAEEELKRLEEEAKKEQEQQNNNSSSNNSSSTTNNNSSSSSSSSNNSSSTNNSNTGSDSSFTSSSSLADGIISTAKSKLGSRYVYGGTGPNVFDCSGFAQWVYRQNGVTIPRTVTTQYYACTLVSNPQPGDLLFFNTTGFLGHVGIYIGGNLFIHAGTSSTGVCYGNLTYAYWQNCYQGAGRFQ